MRRITEEEFEQVKKDLEAEEAEVKREQEYEKMKDKLRDLRGRHSVIHKFAKKMQEIGGNYG